MFSERLVGHFPPTQIQQLTKQRLKGFLKQVGTSQDPVCHYPVILTLRSANSFSPKKSGARIRCLLRSTGQVSKPYVVRGGKITAGVGQFSRDGSATSAANVLGLCSFGVSLPATYLQFWRSDFSLASMRCSGVNCELTFSSCDKKPTLDQCAWGGWGCNICNGGKPGPH